MRHDGPWTAKSDAQNRTLRDNLTLDPATGAVVQRVNFSQRPWIDRAVGMGVAAHEGHLFGWINQLINLFTAMGLIVLCTSAVILWWRRRPEGVLGASLSLRRPRFTFAIAAIVVVLGLYLPLFGLSLFLVVMTEHFILRKIPPVQHWLGLRPAR
jgi:uncharacterized iron-regulated membrane protein